MLENELIKLFIPIIKDGLIDAGINDVVVRSTRQYVQQGAELSAAVYFESLYTKNYGFPSEKSIWDSVNEIENLIQLQQLETSFRIYTLSIQNPADVNSFTALDLANQVSFILQSMNTVQIIESQGVGILRTGQVQSPYFQDDMDRNEQSPFFDFVLTHKQQSTRVIDPVTTINSGFYRV